MEDIRDEMKDSNTKATMSVFSALDDIAYLFNVRAKGDVATCPVGIELPMEQSPMTKWYYFAMTPRCRPRR